MLKVLFVCLGNICRSPAAEGVFLEIIKEKNLTHLFKIDSAGTSGFHQGDLADHRMREHSLLRGIDLTSRSRKFLPKDFEDFDFILVMDKKNERDVLLQSQNEEERLKVMLFPQFCKTLNISEVPDPYYGGDQGFEEVLDIVTDASHGFLAYLEEKGLI